MREKEKNGMYGKNHSPETRMKMSLARLGKARGNTNAQKHNHHYSSPEGIARYKAYKKEYYLKNRQRILLNAKGLRSRKGHKEYMDIIRRKCLLARYGITQVEYLDLLAKQNSCCAICGTDKPGNGRGDRYFDIDHDHITNKVRSLLCRDCNVTVGVIEKKAAKIKLINEYLILHAVTV